jgi:hypothetical protein
MQDSTYVNPRRRKEGLCVKKTQVRIWMCESREEEEQANPGQRRTEPHLTHLFANLVEDLQAVGPAEAPRGRVLLGRFPGYTSLLLCILCCMCTSMHCAVHKLVFTD